MKTKFFAIFLCVCLVGFSQTNTDMFNKKPNFKAQKTLAKGQKQLDNGKYSLAEESFSKLLDESDYKYTALGYLAVVKDQTGDPSQAVKLFQESIAEFQEYKAHLIERKQDYLKSMELDAQTDQAYLNTRKVGHADQIEVKSKASTTRYLSQGNPALQQSDIHTKTNRVDELMNELEQDKKMAYPAFFYFKLGNLYSKSKQWDEAKTAYLNAVNSDPEFKETYANLAVVYFLENDCANAKLMANRAEEMNTPLNPDFKASLFNKCP